MPGQLLTTPCTDFHKKAECRQHTRQFFTFNRRLASASRSQSKYYGIITLRQIIQCLLIHDTLAIMKDNASLFHDADSLIQHGVGEFPNGQDIP